MSSHRGHHLPPPLDTDQRFARPRSRSPTSRRSHGGGNHSSSSNRSTQPSSYPSQAPPGQGSRSRSPARDLGNGRNNSKGDRFAATRYAETGGGSSSNSSRRQLDDDRGNGRGSESRASNSRSTEYRQSYSSQPPPPQQQQRNPYPPQQQQQQQQLYRASYGERERYRDPDAPGSSVQNYQQIPASSNNHNNHSQNDQYAQPHHRQAGGGPSSSASQHSQLSSAQLQAQREYNNANTRDVSGDQIPSSLKAADRRESWTRPSSQPNLPASSSQSNRSSTSIPRPTPSTSTSNPSRPINKAYQDPQSPPHYQRARSPGASYVRNSSDRAPLPSPPLSRASTSRSSRPAAVANGLAGEEDSRSPTPPRPPPASTSTSNPKSKSKSKHSTRSRSRSRSRSSSVRSTTRSRPKALKPLPVKAPIVERSITPERPGERAVSRSPRSQSSASSTGSPVEVVRKVIQDAKMDWLDATEDYEIPGFETKRNVVEEVELVGGLGGVDEDGNEDIDGKKRRRMEGETMRSRREKRVRKDDDVEVSIPTGPAASRGSNGISRQGSHSMPLNGSSMASSTPTGPRALREKFSTQAPSRPSTPSHNQNQNPLPFSTLATTLPPSPPPIAPPGLPVPTGPKSKFIQSFSSTTPKAATTTIKLAGVPTGPRAVAAGVKKFFPGDDEEEDEAKQVEEKAERREREDREEQEKEAAAAEISRKRRESNKKNSLSSSGKNDDRWGKTKASGPSSSSATTSRQQRDVWPPVDARNSALPTGPGAWGRSDGSYPSKQYDAQSSSKGSSSHQRQQYERSSYPQNPTSPSRRHISTSDVNFTPDSYPNSASNTSPIYSDRDSNHQGGERERQRDKDSSDRNRGEDRERDRGRGKFVPPQSDTGYGRSDSGASGQKDRRFEQNDRSRNGDRRRAGEDVEMDGPEGGPIEKVGWMETLANEELEGVGIDSKDEKEEEMGPPAIRTPTEVKPEVILKDTESSVIPGRALVGAEELYERLVQVGEGTYGKVYKARNLESGHLVALKRIRMEAEKDGFPVTAVREIKLLQSLRHPNVVDLIEMMVSKGHVYMVFEYMDHDLTGVLHHPSIHFSPAHLKSLMSQFLLGLGFVHRRGVLHRDLKGSNILIGRDGELKIADFGLARFYARGRNNDYTNRVITQWYKPPELLFGTTIYGAEVDMWSAGCIFLELFTRRPVFQGQDEIHQLDVIFKVTGTPSEAEWPGLEDLPWYELVKPKTFIASQLREVYSKWFTPGGLDVAERLLTLNPKGRPTADETLQMDYFTIEEPRPEVPSMLSAVQGSWHEYESKKARRKQREEAVA